MTEDAKQPKKPISLKLATASLLLLCLTLGLTLWLLDIKEKEKIAQEKTTAQQDLKAAEAQLQKWLIIQKDFTCEVEQAEKAQNLLKEAQKSFTETDYIQSSKHTLKMAPLIEKSLAIYQQHQLLQKTTNELLASCQQLKQNSAHLENYFKNEHLEILLYQEKIRPELDQLNFSFVQEEHSLWKKEILKLTAKINKKEKEYQQHWAEAQKDDSIIAYKVFMESYPLTDQIELIHQRTTDLKEIAARKKLAEQKAQKEKEEELKKQRKIIEERQAKLLAEQKQKRELEQVKTVEFDDGSSYTGQLEDEKPNGTGTYSYTNSNVYRGQWQNGYYHGTGTYEFYTGVKYKGQWKMGLRHGQGQVSWINGDTFKGTWIDGKIHGRGLWTPRTGQAIQKNFHQGIDIGTKTYEAHMKYLDLQKDRYEGKRLSRGQQKAFGFMLRYNKALEMLYKGNPQVTFPDYPIHIPGHSSYLSSYSSTKKTEAHEMELKKIFFKLKRYALTTKDTLGMEENEEYSSAEMGGYNIITANLGVILDNSGSMTPYLDKLRYKIQKKFKKHAFIEVTGCSLYTNDDIVNHENAIKSTLTAIKFLVNEKGVDTIYWFSDLNDGRTSEALEELNYFLEKNLISFYLSSIDNPPDKELKKVVNDSGGKVLKF